MSRDCYGEEVPNHRTGVRSRWTPDNLYFLFVCPYDRLHLKPRPELATKTDGLWIWDVAEVFIGSLTDPIHCYKEFELSPQGEWLDLAIDLTQPDTSAGAAWRSGLQVAARIDQIRKTWYASMRIPIHAVQEYGATPNNIFRINFFRSQGPEPVEIAWSPPLQASFHAPEQFGSLLLV